MIGTRVIILPDVSIGDNVIIGAGAIVSKDIPSNCIAAGVPCKPLGDFETFVDKREQLQCVRNSNIIWEKFNIEHKNRSE